jgi:cobalt/nickel transport system permease protein
MSRRRIGIVTVVFVGLVLTVGLAAFASPFASSKPDGLEKVAADKGFLATAKDSPTADSPLADYAVRDVADERASTGLAGVVGVGITLAVAASVFGGLWSVARRRAVPSSPLAG